jgi:hypothetical protein
MDAKQALEAIAKVGEGPHLARVFLDERDCGAYWPATAAEAVRAADEIRPGIDYRITTCQI